MKTDFLAINHFKWFIYKQVHQVTGESKNRQVTVDFDKQYEYGSVRFLLEHVFRLEDWFNSLDELLILSLEGFFWEIEFFHLEWTTKSGHRFFHLPLNRYFWQSYRAAKIDILVGHRFGTRLEFLVYALILTPSDLLRGKYTTRRCNLAKLSRFPLRCSWDQQLIKWGAPSRWSFRPISAWGRIETITIR